jgi:hypothetical protein
MKRLYVVVRADLPIGLQMAQSCHAAREFSYKFPEVELGENLVVLQAQNEGELLRLWLEGDQRSGVLWREQDVGNQYTAMAYSGRERKHLSSLPLAGRPPKPPKKIAIPEAQVREVIEFFDQNLSLRQT